MKTTTPECSCSSFVADCPSCVERKSAPTSCAAGLPWCRSDFIDLDGSLFHTGEESFVAGGLGTLLVSATQEPGQPVESPTFSLRTAEELGLPDIAQLIGDLAVAFTTAGMEQAR